jgi:hypothetical protein
MESHSELGVGGAFASSQQKVRERFQRLRQDRLESAQNALYETERAALNAVSPTAARQPSNNLNICTVTDDTSHKLTAFVTVAVHYSTQRAPKARQLLLGGNMAVHWRGVWAHR